MRFLRRRIHLFEWLDQAWLPQFFRKGLCDLLVAQYAHHGIYKPAAYKLLEFMVRCGQARFVGLAAGTGGPWVSVLATMRALTSLPIIVLLTDKYPVCGKHARKLAEKYAKSRAMPDASFDGVLAFHPTSVDATNVPEELRGIRVLFSAFHHFRPQDAQHVLRQAVAVRAPIAIFEFTERRWQKVLGMLAAPLDVWRLAWRIPSFGLTQHFFTYGLPIIPLLYVWEGAVSHLRTYTPEELQTMAVTVSPESYVWETGRLQGADGSEKITYLLGYPRPISA